MGCWSSAVAFAVSCLSLAAQEPAATVRLVGRIVDVLNEGVPAAEVWATDAAGQRLGRTVADGDGYYQLPRLPAVALRLHARAERRTEASLAVATNGLVRAATLVLEDAAPLRGRVVHGDGTPAAGAAVLVTGELPMVAPFDWVAETTTDARGEWSVPAAPLRPLVACAWLPGHALGQAPVLAGEAEPARVVLPVGRLTPRAVQVTGLPAGCAAQVRCEPGRSGTQAAPRLPAAALSAPVAADGSASLWPLPCHHEVRVDAVGFTSLPVYVPCEAGAVAPLAFTMWPLPADLLAPATTLTGVVVDHVGQALPGVRLTSRCEDVYGATVTTAADGSFTLVAPVRTRVLCQVGLVAGPWRLGDPRAVLGADGRTWFTVAADPDVPLRLAALPTGSVRGVLRGAEGVPLGAARVHFTQVVKKDQRTGGVVTATDPAGRLEIAGLPAGDYVLTVFGDGVGQGSVPVRVVALETVSPGELVFAPVGEVRGVLRDPSGAPRPGAILTLYNEKTKVPAGLRVRMLATGFETPILTDREGRFRVGGVAPGDWTISQQLLVGAGGRSGAALHRFTLAAGETATLELDAAR